MADSKKKAGKPHANLQQTAHAKPWDDERSRDYSISPWLVLKPDEKTLAPDNWRNCRLGHTYNGMSDKGVTQAQAELQRVGCSTLAPLWDQLSNAVYGPVTECAPNEHTRLHCTRSKSDDGVVTYLIRCVVPANDLEVKINGRRLEVKGSAHKQLCIYRSADDVEDMGRQLHVHVDWSTELVEDIPEPERHEVRKEAGFLFIDFHPA